MKACRCFVNYAKRSWFTCTFPARGAKRIASLCRLPSHVRPRSDRRSGYMYFRDVLDFSFHIEARNLIEELIIKDSCPNKPLNPPDSANRDFWPGRGNTYPHSDLFPQAYGKPQCSNTPPLTPKLHITAADDSELDLSILQHLKTESFPVTYQRRQTLHHQTHPRPRSINPS